MGTQTGTDLNAVNNAGTQTDSLAKVSQSKAVEKISSSSDLTTQINSSTSTDLLNTLLEKPAVPSNSQLINTVKPAIRNINSSTSTDLLNTLLEKPAVAVRKTVEFSSQTAIDNVENSQFIDMFTGILPLITSNYVSFTYAGFLTILFGFSYSFNIGMVGGSKFLFLNEIPIRHLIDGLKIGVIVVTFSMSVSDAWLLTPVEALISDLSHLEEEFHTLAANSYSEQEILNCLESDGYEMEL